MFKNIKSDIHKIILSQKIKNIWVPFYPALLFMGSETQDQALNLM